MNGAEAMVRALVSEGVELCFANPGTSEMHFLEAMDAQPGLRSVLALHETVATGAADGYGRLAGRPASTLLHLGPGLANGLSNLHNASRALTPIVNIVGDHATGHRRLDAPLTSDIEALARTVGACRVVLPASDVAAETAAAVAQSRGPMPGVSTLLLPADTAWSETAVLIDAAAHRARAAVPAEPDADAIAAAAAALRRPGAALFLGFSALRGEALELAGRIAEATGASLIAQTTNPVIERGSGRVRVERLPFAPDAALRRLASVPALVLAGARAPVAFFARPGMPGRLWHPACQLIEVTAPHESAIGALAALCEHVGAPPLTMPARVMQPPAPTASEHAWIGETLAALMPEGTIVVDEAMTHGAHISAATSQAPAHLWLQNMGGSIGYGSPAALGAALAAPGRPVVAIVGDGSAMYTLQALWTQARERLQVITLIIANRAYRILQLEAARMDIQAPGAAMTQSLQIDGPELDFVKMAEGMGVFAVRVGNAAQLRSALAEGFRATGPMLIQVDV
ncbi:MAG: acetolactate synthase large subunit [Comamonadaceae bacterium]|nr:MAG: acetolactate synthase large subunit [Comamonadaceae bacterium]